MWIPKGIEPATHCTMIGRFTSKITSCFLEHMDNKSSPRDLFHELYFCVFDLSDPRDLFHELYFCVFDLSDPRDLFHELYFCVFDPSDPPVGSQRIISS